MLSQTLRHVLLAGLFQDFIAKAAPRFGQFIRAYFSRRGKNRRRAQERPRDALHVTGALVRPPTETDLNSVAELVFECPKLLGFDGKFGRFIFQFKTAHPSIAVCLLELL